MSALSSGKVDKHEYLTAEEILPSNQCQLIEQPKFTYSPQEKAFKKKKRKKRKATEDQEKKVEPEHQTKSKSIESIFPKELENN